jgi:hypothetical protein
MHAVSSDERRLSHRPQVRRVNWPPIVSADQRVMQTWRTRSHFPNVLHVLKRWAGFRFTRPNHLAFLRRAHARRCRRADRQPVDWSHPLRATSGEEPGTSGR